METRMELFAPIRRDARIESRFADTSRSGNGADGVGTGGAATEKSPVRCSPTLDPFKSAIDAMLTADVDAPHKQRHTTPRILARLADEHGAQRLSYSTVRDYVRVRRAQIDVEANDNLTSTGQLMIYGSLPRPGGEHTVGAASFAFRVRLPPLTTRIHGTHERRG